MTRERGAPIVVKLGGSLLAPRPEGRPPIIREVLDILVCARRPVVVVPGGGAFADTVRSEQARLGYADHLAHRMALLAMHQTALALVGLWPAVPPDRRRRGIVADSAAAIRDALAKGRVPVWAPLAMADRDGTIPEDWSATSDGLAAWLARKLGARGVVLVKSCPVDAGAALSDLVGQGIVDPLFRDLVVAQDLDWLVLGAGDGAHLAAAIDADMQP